MTAPYTEDMRRLDACIHREVFGVTDPQFYDLSDPSWPRPDVPAYSTDMTAAISVAEKIMYRAARLLPREEDYLPCGCLELFHLGTNIWAATFDRPRDGEWYEIADNFPASANASSAALAICRAAIKLLREFAE